MTTLMDLTSKRLGSQSKNVDQFDVDPFVADLRQLFKDNEVAVASKILFLINPETITPYDTNVTNAAWKIDRRRINSYIDYYNFFTDFRDAHREETKGRLTAIDDLSFIESEFKGELQHLNLEAVRINRYTDQLLVAIGKEKT